MTKTFKKIEKENKHIGMFHLEFDDDQVSADNGVAIPDVIHIVPIGQWDHDLYGPITVTASDIREFVQNFNMGIRKGVFITAGHEGYEELPAVGWFTELEARDDGLWGTVEWNELGKESLGDKQFKYFSPEFYRDYEDPQTHDIYRNVLTGGALTKSPYFKELEAVIASDKREVVMFSDRNITKNFKSKFNDMDLKTILAKKIEELSAEETAFIKEHAAELSEDEKSSHAAVLEEVKTEEVPEVAPKAEDAPAPVAEVAPEVAPVAEPKIEASEKVMISAGELAALRDKADKGALAFAEIEARKITDSVKSLSFSDTNKSGKFLPKSSDNLRAFMETLNEGQRTKFSALIGELPSTQVFGEVGGSGAEDGTAKAEVDSKIDVKVKTGMKYSDALKEVMSENVGLEERYDRELKVVKGQ